MTAATPGQARDLRAEQDYAEFAGWFAAQGFDDQGRFDQDEMGFAFEAGMETARELAAQDARPAPVLHQLAGLIAGWRQAASELAGQPMSSDELAEAQTLREVIRQVLAVIENATSDPQPAPELAAAIAESRALRALVAEVLGCFGPSGSGHSARVGVVQVAKWRTRAGLTP